MRIGASHLKFVFETFASLPSQLAKRRQSRWQQVVLAACGIANNPGGFVNEVARIRPALAQECLNSGIDVGIQSLIPSLLEALDNEDISVKRSAIIALGQTGDESIVERLIDLSKDSDSAIRDASILALRELGRKGIHHLIEMLKTTNDVTAQQVANTLGGIKEEFLPLLVDCINNEDIKFVGRVIYTLGLTGNKLCVEPLLKKLSSNAVEIQTASVISLSLIADLSAFPHILKLLQVGDEEVRVVAARYLNLFKNEDIAKHLERALMDKSVDVHLASFHSLEEMKHVPHAKKCLTAYRRISRKDPKRRQKNCSFLYEKYGSYGLFHALAHTYKDFQAYWQIGQYLATIPEDEFLSLGEKLQTYSSRQKGFWAYAAGLRKESSACRYLTNLLEEEKDVFCIGQAIKSLGDLNSKQSIPSIEKFVNDSSRIYSNSDATLGMYAAQALKKLSESASCD